MEAEARFKMDSSICILMDEKGLGEYITTNKLENMIRGIPLKDFLYNLLIGTAKQSKKR